MRSSWVFNPEKLEFMTEHEGIWEPEREAWERWLGIRHAPSKPKLQCGGIVDQETIRQIMDNSSICSGVCPDFDKTKNVLERVEKEVSYKTYLIPNIEEVIFNETGNATIVRWKDNTKTIVRCGDGETFDRYTGFIACVAKKLFGGTTTAKKLMNSLDKKYQAKLKAEREAKEKEKRDQEAAAAKAKADKLREKKNAEAMEELVNLFLMNTEAKQRAEEILAAAEPEEKS